MCTVSGNKFPQKVFILPARVNKAIRSLRRLAGVLLVAQDIARSVLAGEIAPSQAAKRIWWDLYDRFGQPEKLRSFAGFASEYEDRPQDRDEYTRLIIEECEALVRNRD